MQPSSHLVRPQRSLHVPANPIPSAAAGLRSLAMFSAHEVDSVIALTTVTTRLGSALDTFWPLAPRHLTGDAAVSAVAFARGSHRICCNRGRRVMRLSGTAMTVLPLWTGAARQNGSAPRLGYLRLTAMMITWRSSCPAGEEPGPRSVSITVTAKPLRASAPANLSS